MKRVLAILLGALVISGGLGATGLSGTQDRRDFHVSGN